MIIPLNRRSESKIIHSIVLVTLSLHPRKKVAKQLRPLFHVAPFFIYTRKRGLVVTTSVFVVRRRTPFSRPACGRHTLLQTLARYISLRARSPNDESRRAWMLSRGSARRPVQLTEQSAVIRWALASGHATDAAALDN